MRKWVGRNLGWEVRGKFEYWEVVKEFRGV
jgi:hypothetical protein